MRGITSLRYRGGWTLALALAGAPLLASGWSSRGWSVHCNDPNPCSPASEIYEGLLVHASQWLDGLGFAEPKLNRVPDDPDVFLASVDDEYLRQGKEAAGKYNDETHYLALSSEYFFTLGKPGQTHEDGAFNVAASFEFTPVHELFHAVQNAYQSDGRSVRHAWISEGMADAVLRAYADEFEPELGAKMIARSYAVPLHRPGNTTFEYGTWNFWLDVGRRLGSPSGIAYLKDVLEEDLTENDGLDGVDRALPGGLAMQLPLFFAGVDLKWLDPDFDPDRLAATLPPGSASATESFPLEVPEVAGRGVEVAVRTPKGEAVEVHIALKPDLPDLHLIVDGEILPARSTDYVLPDGGARTYRVVVANVAAPASATRDQDVDLEVKLRRAQSCSMTATVSGDVNGGHSGDVAYFNVFAEGVREGAAAGTFLDPTVDEAMKGLAEFAGWVDDFLADEDEEQESDGDEAGADEEKENKSPFRQALESEWDLSGTDTFGLSLVALHLPGPTLKSSGNDDLIGEALSGDGAAAGGLGQTMGFLGSTFSLGATGTSDFRSTDEHTVGKTFTVDLSTVSVAPGELDGNLGGVKFFWKPGQPGGASLTFRHAAPGVIAGSLRGDLYTERAYTGGRRLRIKIQADFLALEGAFSCQ
jgi:hypothetical protein